MFTTEARSTHSSEYSLIKNYLLRALCASVVDPLLDRQRENNRRNIFANRENKDNTQ